MSSPHSLEDRNFDVVADHPHVLMTTKSGCFGKDHALTFNQAIAVVRHGERLDSTREWSSSAKELRSWPHDCPLTHKGMRASREVGQKLGNTGNSAPFEVIVSSPYLRCAQSASEIARELKLPVIFDDDVGEVGENVGKAFDPNAPPHRGRSELLRYLHKEYPDVEYAMTDDRLQFHGGYPMFPESLSQARSRFARKAQHICQSAAMALKSVIIVTHADALDAIVGAMKMSWVLTEVPPSAFFVAEREVRVMERRARKTRRVTDDFVFGSQAAKWSVELCTSIKCTRKPEIVNTRMQELRRRCGKLDRVTFDLENYCFRSHIAAQQHDSLDKGSSFTERETTVSTCCSGYSSNLDTGSSYMGRCSNAGGGQAGICEESSSCTM